MSAQIIDIQTACIPIFESPTPQLHVATMEMSPRGRSRVHGRPPSSRQGPRIPLVPYLPEGPPSTRPWPGQPPHA